MKSRPKVGATGELAFKIEPQHAIDFATDGMPAVLSTSNLVGCLDDNERSVGTEIELRHLAPTPVGQTIHCTARVIHAEDCEVTFQISARDERELIARGLHKRAIIQLEKFSKRVQEKSA
jgi:fluoroacetyl-CoA thioesterase